MQQTTPLLQTCSSQALIEKVMRSRLICRPRPGFAFNNLYQKILTRIRRQLEQKINKHDHFSLSELKTFRDSAFRDALDENTLEKLAIKAQSSSCVNQNEQRYCLTELINAIRLSGKLRSRGKYPVDIYGDAVNRTFSWIALNIDSFNPQRGRFLAWVNYRLDISLREAYAEIPDPLIQSQNQQIIRCKHKLTSIVNQVGKVGIDFWLVLILKGINVGTQVSLYLSVLHQLARLRMTNKILFNSLMLEIAQTSLSMNQLQRVDAETMIIDNLAQPEPNASLSELIKKYLKFDPDKLCAKHLNNCPQATFQAISLARLEDQSWQEIADSFGVSVAAVKNFFQRHLQKIAPLIKQQIQL